MSETLRTLEQLADALALALPILQRCAEALTGDARAEALEALAAAQAALAKAGR